MSKSSSFPTLRRPASVNGTKPAIKAVKSDRKSDPGKQAAAVQAPTVQRRPKVRRIWFYQSFGVVRGPVSSRRLWKLAQRRDISADTFVRKGDTGDWVHAERIDGLFDPNFGKKFATLHLIKKSAPEETLAAREAVHEIKVRDEESKKEARRAALERWWRMSLPLAGSCVTLLGMLGLNTTSGMPNPKPVLFDLTYPQVWMLVILAGILASAIGVTVLLTGGRK